MCLKLSVSFYKGVLQAILFLAVFSNCVFGKSRLTKFFSLTVPDFVVFFMSSDRKFSEDSKNGLKSMIWSLQVGFIRVLFLTVL